MQPFRMLVPVFASVLAWNIVTVSVTTRLCAEEPVSEILDHTMKKLDGKEVDLKKEYDGKVLLIVNVASQCGLTKQYTQLQALQEKYADQGFTVLGFPCNQFLNQEPGTAEQIQQFCEKEYQITFDLFSKVEVNGSGACDLYKKLTAVDTQPAEKGVITWNFEKFLVNRKGDVVARFAPRTTPDAPDVISAIEKELAAK